MIAKYSLIATLVLILVTASDPFFGTDLSYRPVPKQKKEDVQELKWMSTDAFKDYLLDHDDRVSDIFEVTPFYFPNVHFWFLVYTQFDSSHEIIHDKNNLRLIYKILDFSSLHKKSLPKNTLYILQNKISKEKIDIIKDDLQYLINSPFSLDDRAKKIYRIIKEAKLKIPEERTERISFFKELRDNIRTQTGQKNFIHDGIMRSLPYQRFLNNYFTNKKLPTELLSIPFLESSFNPKAESKVGALGVWQFMPLIASYFVPKKTSLIDYRSNVGIASVSAGFLMEENFKILKSWDLAVTAYNSGTKHLLKSKRQLALVSPRLEDIIRHSNSAHFGFASKNFYSEFLALTRALAYKEEIFPDLHDHDRPDVNAELHFFITKCSLRLDKTLDNKLLEDVKFHNYHIDDFTKVYSRGLILTSKGTLPQSKFFKIPFEKLLVLKPKDWLRIVGTQSCSTR